MNNDMTPKELHDELKRLAEKATPGPWEADCGGTHRRDEAQVVMLGGPDAKPQRLFDTLNSDVAEIAHEADEDGTCYFDCQGADNFKLIESLVNNLPTLLRALSALSALEGVKGALGPLVQACEQEFCGEITNDATDDEAVGGGDDGDMKITFGMIRHARSALSKLKEAGL